jgi:hypothetical protein
MRQKLFENDSHYGLAGAMAGPLDGILTGTGGAAPIARMPRQPFRGFSDVAVPVR